MKDYTLSDDNKSVTVMDARRQKITLKEVKTEDDNYRDVPKILENLASSGQADLENWVNGAACSFRYTDSFYERP